MERKRQRDAKKKIRIFTTTKIRQANGWAAIPTGIGVESDMREMTARNKKAIPLKAKGAPPNV